LAHDHAEEVGMSEPNVIADTITFDSTQGQLYIDGWRFPWHIAAEPSVKRGAMTTVTIEIFTESVGVVE
jgi:hypothetical protein